MHTLTCPWQTAAEQYPDADAVIFSDTRISYADLHRCVQRTQSTLEQNGIARGDYVALWNDSRFEYLVVMIALWRMGATACVFNTRCPRETFFQELATLACRHLLVGKPSGVKNFPSGIRVHTMEECVSREPGNAGMSSQRRVTLEQEATLMLTSGTTAVPKRVVHTLGNHYYSALGSNENIPLRPGDRWLLALPLYHVSGLSIMFRCVLGGGTVVLPDVHDKGEDAMMRTISDHGLTHISLVPTQLFRLLQDTKNVSVLKNLKAILLGGSSIPPQLLAPAKDFRLPVCISYGLTEMSSQVATSAIPASDRPLEGKAKVLRFREMKIAPDHEVLVRGETLFKGYWDSGKVVRSTLAAGWFPTGDCGEMDGEGCLTIRGRKDNMFISGGENIHPEEIEQHLLAREEIRQAVVVPVEDREFGCRPVAFLEMKPGKSLTRAALEAHLRQKLIALKIPKDFFHWPRNIPEDTLKANRRHFVSLAAQFSMKLVRID